MNVARGNRRDRRDGKLAQLIGRVLAKRLFMVGMFASTERSLNLAGAAAQRSSGCRRRDGLQTDQANISACRGSHGYRRPRPCAAHHEPRARWC